MRKEYERYKPTGIEWISQIPAHWKVSPIKRIFDVFTGATPDSNNSEYWNGKMVWITPADFNSKQKYIKTGKKFITKEGYLSCATRLVPSESIIFSKRAPVGKVVIVKKEMCTSQGCLSCVKKQDSNANELFFYYSFLTIEKWFNAIAAGTTFNEIGTAVFSNTKILVPPRSEQDQIVRFLDWKVSSINKLISNYRHQIELFDEMKQRKIDEAVFKGMRKSKIVHNNDIRWDIDYPEYWQIRRTRESFSFRKGLSITKANLEEAGVAVISYGQVHSKKNTGFALNEDIFRYVNKSYLETNKNCLVEKGDFIFADTSEDVIGCGNCVYIDRDETIFAGYHSIIAHPSGSTNNKYLAYLFKSPTWRYQIRKKVNGVKVYSITQKMLKDAFILIPPSDEQEEIAKYLDEICVKIDAALQKLEEKISNLHDLKIRLIADTVTGKIDVRNITVPEFEYVDDTADDDSEDESEENEDCNGEED